MKRSIILAYAVASYLVFMAVLIYAIGFFGNVYVPRSIDSAPLVSTGSALLSNLALLLLFAVQHSGMARPAFKQRFATLFPQATERSTYVLTSSLGLGVIMIFWQPMGGVVWDVGDGTPASLMNVLYMLGWAFMIWASFLINHLDFLGVKQAYQAYRGWVYIEPAFRTPAVYRLIRHPIYVGWLMVLWASPVMTVCHLMLSAGFTAYIFFGIRFEERDLLRAHSSYAQYRRKVPALFPSFKRYLRRKHAHPD